MNKPFALLTSLLLLPACQTTRTVTLVGMTDYHSHAVPFYSEGEPGQGGVARALAYLREAKARPDTLVVSGGDTVNKGVPTWSDEYGCVEWPWFNGVLDVMALGNHDLDYGAEAFERCRASASYPLLCANLVGAGGAPYLQVEGRPYVVREVGGVRVGFFAVAGPDMQRLVKPENLPAGTRWTDATEAARAVVEALRTEEHVDAVVLLGHQLREDDEALARAVPGIDVIMGSHSHQKTELGLLPGTRTWYLAPYQYLAYLSEVRLRFRGGKLERVEGGLVKMDGTKREEPETAAEVGRLQRALVAKHPERFEVLGQLDRPLRDEGLTTGQAEVGTWAAEVWRRAAWVHAFFALSASFRGGAARGGGDGGGLPGRDSVPQPTGVGGADGGAAGGLGGPERVQAGDGQLQPAQWHPLRGGGRAAGAPAGAEGALPPRGGGRAGEAGGGVPGGDAGLPGLRGRRLQGSAVFGGQRASHGAECTHIAHGRTARGCHGVRN